MLVTFLSKSNTGAGAFLATRRSEHERFLWSHFCSVLEILLFVFRNSKKVRGNQFGEIFEPGLKSGDALGEKNRPPQAKNMMKSDDEFRPNFS